MSRSLFYRVAGVVFLVLAKGKNVLRGYSSPKPFDIGETAKCIAYDLAVVNGWLDHFVRYRGAIDGLASKRVLELGPGSDLGIGLYLLARGCAEYNACDVNNLAGHAPDVFYDRLFEKLSSIDERIDVDALRAELQKSRAGVPGRLKYVVRPDFDLPATFGLSSIDIVFSQAAFEHFDNIDRTIQQLSLVCKPGATLIAEIDLKTHSRWIRDKDPNNIYRFPDWLYRAFAFRGIPNRARPYQYREALEAHGWCDVEIVPIEVASREKADGSGLAKPFVEPHNQMTYLSIMLCATKA